jgi:hypothetical protein
MPQKKTQTRKQKRTLVITASPSFDLNYQAAESRSTTSRSAGRIKNYYIIRKKKLLHQDLQAATTHTLTEAATTHNLTDANSGRRLKDRYGEPERGE